MKHGWGPRMARGAGVLLLGVTAGCDSESKDTERAGLALAPACGAPSGPLPDLKLTEVVGGLDLPTQMVPFAGDERLLVLEQEGLIVAVRGDEGQVEPFADLTDRVHTRLPEYSEWGLLGLAFHPDFERNGRVFIHYSSVERSSALVGGETLSIAAGDGVISEFSVNADGLLDTESEQRLLVVPQPELNHNGGGIEFSPMDGYLYIGLGDGGGQGDPNGNAQDLSSLLGKMLRIDVDSGVPYSIPEGNMTGDGVRPEIWSYGLRNPWRISFDPCTADLYIADVGQNLFEEVDFEPAGAGGRNYGWNVRESASCFNPVADDPAAERPSFTNPLESCDEQGLTPPLFDYNRTWGCSLTGGGVYRGAKIPGLVGQYLYADYCSGNFGAFPVGGESTAAVDITADLNPGGLISFSSFGADHAGELYVLSHSGGAFPTFVGDAGVLYRIDAE